MKSIQAMAERHLNTALLNASGQRLIAAADPNQFIDEAMIDEFIDLASLAWSDGYTLLASLVPENVEITALYNGVTDNAIRNASNAYYDMLNKLIGDKAFKTLREPLFGEFLKDATVQYGDVRPLLVTLGGGSPDSDAPVVGGITSGQIAHDWMGQNGVPLTRAKIWLYGYEDQPRRTFNGHLQMDGLVFEEWDDEALEVAPQDYWLRRSHYQPGDHWGCACVVAPYIPNFGEEYQIDT